MRFEPIPIKQNNPLMEDYLNNNDRLEEFLDYPTLNINERLLDLKNQTYDRNALTSVLEKMNNEWEAPTASLKNISRLKQSDSVVVIGGQQAGLLTGPLYTINKVISLIQYSRKQEKKLGIPVIPVFWVAGEDHDFAEINHVNMLSENRMKKMPIGQHVQEGMPVGDIKIEQGRTAEWLKKLFLLLPETVHTKSIYKQLLKILEASETYVDFFAQLIFWLFPTEGIVLINSSDPRLRAIESKHFTTLINAQEDIAQTIYHTLARLKRHGYSIDVQAEKDDAHLFYHLNNSRTLLKRSKEGQWIGKQDELVLTTEQMLQIASAEPHLLSNNVMTRPIMQELLFPTLAFIGGPGEISYWMLLRDTFQTLNMKIPPLVPRLSFTYIDRKLESSLENFDLTVNQVINHGVYQSKMNYLTSCQPAPFDKIFTEFKETIKQIHEPLKDTAYQIRHDIGQFADRNLFHLHATVDQLEGRMKRAIEEEQDQAIHNFDLLQNHLRPNHSLQERIWCILPLLNQYNTSFITKLAAEQCSINDNHFAVYL